MVIVLLLRALRGRGGLLGERGFGSSGLIWNRTVLLLIVQPFSRFLPLRGVGIDVEVILLTGGTRVTNPFADLPFLKVNEMKET